MGSSQSEKDKQLRRGCGEKQVPAERVVLTALGRSVPYGTSDEKI